MHAQLDAVEPAERIGRFGEQVANDEASNAPRVHNEAVARVARICDPRLVAAAVEIERVLRKAAGPIQAMSLIDVQAEELRFADAAVHRPGEHDGMIAEDVG